MAAYGDTFLYSDEDDDTGHLHVIITEPSDDGRVITVPVTTRRGKSDAIFPLKPGDHPYIRHASVLTFAFAKIRLISEIDRVLQDKDAKQREPMDEKLLSRARSALMESDFTPYEVRDFFRSMDKYKA